MRTFLFILITTLTFGQEREKPAVESTKLLDSVERAQVREYLNDKSVSRNVTPAKNDYVDANDRGTVLFDPEKGTNLMRREVFKVANYAFHKVIIPDGTTIEEVNFSQAEPFTDAIQGENLTFIRCNLNNVVIKPSWTLISSLAIHTRRKTDRRDGVLVEVQDLWKPKEEKWVENAVTEIPESDSDITIVR